MEKISNFIDTDDFEGIIKKNVSGVTQISGVSTGWTNYVFKVQTEKLTDGNVEKETFIFRFPRNHFFAEAILKECKMQAFVKDKISFVTPDLHLQFEGNKPYTFHKSISGQSLSHCYNDLSPAELETLSQDICTLLEQFYSIDISGSGFEKVSDFLDRLSVVSGEHGYDLSMHDGLKALENAGLVFSHGDFNPGNLILKDHKLVGVIDFAFSGSSCRLTDLSRIIGRCPRQLREILTDVYEKKFQCKVSVDSLETLLGTWQYVEEKYINYIRENHPSIVLPDLV